MSKKEEKNMQSLEKYFDQVKVNVNLTDEEKVLRGYYQKVEPNLDLILTMLGEGFTETTIQEFLGVSSTAWVKYKNELPSFHEHIVMGRMKILSKVENSIYQQALGEVALTTTKTKEIFNPQTGEFEPIEREIQVKQERPNDKMAEYILRRFSPQWRGVEDAEDQGQRDIISSIGSLIDTIMADDIPSAKASDETSNKIGEKRLDADEIGPQEK